MKFELLGQDGAARLGEMHFARGVVDTPAFMPVGTYGTVKAMTPEELQGLGAPNYSRQHLPSHAARQAQKSFSYMATCMILCIGKDRF